MVEFINWGVRGEEYERLLEDIRDLAISAERRDEPTVTF
jgi:hypothetical protein